MQLVQSSKCRIPKVGTVRTSGTFIFIEMINNIVSSHYFADENKENINIAEINSRMSMCCCFLFSAFFYYIYTSRVYNTSICLVRKPVASDL